MSLEPNTQLKLADESARGQNALHVLTNPAYMDAMKQLKQEIIDKWEACPARDLEGREWLWRMYQNAGKFDSILRSIMETGKMADITLAQEGIVESAARRVANLWR